jgi:hypothetical protein
MEQTFHYFHLLFFDDKWTIHLFLTLNNNKKTHYETKDHFYIKPAFWLDVY